MAASFSILSCSTPQITVTFKLNNTKEDVVMKINRNSIIQNAPTPTSYHKVFSNWRIDDQDVDIARTLITKDTTLSAHYNFDYDKIYNNKDTEELRKKGTANLRIMSFNLLTSIYNNHPLHHGYGPDNKECENDGRDDQARDTIIRYQPDIIGFQECDQNSDCEATGLNDHGWYDYFKSEHEKSQENFPYVIINDNERTYQISGESSKKTIFSTIAYNTKTIAPELENGKPVWGTKLSLYSDNNNCRYLTYGVFHLVNNPSKKFVATSTHWNLSSSTMLRRILQAKESADYSLFLKEKYNCPVISCGDYNQDDFTEPYLAYLAESGFNDTKYNASEVGLLTPTYHLGTGKGTKEDYSSEYWYRTKETLRSNRSDIIETIDHIFASKELKIHYYDVISEERAMYASDHMPSYADLELQ